MILLSAVPLFGAKKEFKARIQSNFGKYLIVFRSEIIKSPFFKAKGYSVGKPGFALHKTRQPFSLGSKAYKLWQNGNKEKMLLFGLKIYKERQECARKKGEEFKGRLFLA